MEYTKELTKRFRNPKFVKKIKNPDAVGEVGNIRCGDILKLEIKVGKDKGKEIIKDIGFQTFGCPA
ncbi:MAG: iron-sulfur cluster assembly scaffold protein, partial [Nanoarchaeota archaeon]|nr:iron-sulfur cluster assembly scaffold protein [Nanoarchaeota archaeon]